LALIIGGCFAAPARAASTLDIAASAAVPTQEEHVTLTFSGSADAIDSSGDGPALYAVIHEGTAACQPSYEADNDAYGWQDNYLALVNSDSGGTPEPPGSFSTLEDFQPTDPTGYLICAWLEGDGGAGNQVFASASHAVSAVPPKVSLAVSVPVPPRPHQPFEIDYTTGTPYEIALKSAIKEASEGPCAASAEKEYEAQQSELPLLGPQVTSSRPIVGDPKLTTATDTEPKGSYVICTWIEGPNFMEVDAMKTTPVTVGDVAPPQPGIRVKRWSASRRHGISISGTTTKPFQARLLVVAKCHKSAHRTRARPSNGAFHAHLHLPRCSRQRRVTLSVSWSGSSTYSKQSRTRSVRIRP
jgi:hypothetical protein